MYELIFTKNSSKFLKKISKKEQLRMLSSLAKLQTDPLNSTLNIKKMHTEENTYRLRVGNMRALYQFLPGQKTVEVLDIDYRGNIYKP